MKTKTTLIRAGLICAIVLASGYVLKPYLNQIRNKWSPSDTENVSVLVARQYIPPFQAMKTAHVSVRHYPAAYVPPGALRTVADILQENGEAAFSSIVGIPEGQPITRMVVTDVHKERGLAALLRSGKVAVSFSVDRARAAGGWIQPGDTIAIFQKTIPSSGRRSPDIQQTRLLLSEADVLAVDKNHIGAAVKPRSTVQEVLLDASDSSSQIITILTSTRDAAAVVEAQESGPLSVVLRSFGDDLPWLAK